MVRHLAAGRNATETGALLGISAGVVRNHRQNVYRKLGLNRAALLTRWAVRQGIVANGRKRGAA